MSPVPGWGAAGIGVGDTAAARQVLFRRHQRSKATHRCGALWLMASHPVDMPQRRRPHAANARPNARENVVLTGLAEHEGLSVSELPCPLVRREHDRTCCPARRRKGGDRNAEVAVD